MEAWRLKMEPWRSKDPWTQIRITVVRSEIRMRIPDQHFSAKSDPDPYSDEMLDPDPQPWS